MRIHRDATLVVAVVEAIKPRLAGLGPAVQGAVLADLTAMWLAGYQPAEAREQILADWLATMRKLVLVNAEQTATPNREDQQ